MNFYTWVKQNIHRGLYCTTRKFQISVRYRVGHYNEDGKWVKGVYLVHWFRRGLFIEDLSDRYPEETELYDSLSELVQRLREIGEPGKWATLKF